ncbi:MAG TPA: hypothetical protein PLF81_07055 [Candidatus Anammoximicrobium sp.]|nr:hypothetical protein [Candidatus Anammoximicrobium sp.]
MTTAKTRRPATAAGPPRGVRQTKSGTAHEPIPILIRLPELQAEPEPRADNEAVTAEAGPRATIPLLPTPMDPGPRPASSAESPRPNAGAARGEIASDAAMPPPHRRRLSWSRLRPPRWAVRGGTALALLAVLVIAYSAIVGPSPKSNSAVAEGEMTSDEILPPSGLPAVGLPAPPAPAAQETAAIPPTSGDAAQDVAKEERQPTAKPANEAGGNGGQAEPPSADAAKAAAPSADQTATSSPQEEPVPQDPTGPAAAAGGLNLGGQANVPAPAAADTPLPLTSGTPQHDTGAGVDAHHYPVTDPATFQYPPDYHLRLPGQARGSESLNAWPAPSGAGQADREPITARLQPRIEPPPVR